MIQKNEKGQAIPAPTIPFGQEAFNKIDHTEIRWMANASIFINSHGSHVMIDPLLEGFDMTLLAKMPIMPKDIPHLDAILITHIDNDHFSRMTCKDVQDVCAEYHGPHYVAEEMVKEGLNGLGHDIDEQFTIQDLTIQLTPAKHNWQSESAKYNYRQWKEEDYCGYWIETKDGTIWLPGDSRLLDSHLHMPNPDVILFDFSDNEWHITLDGAIKLANTYPNADLICIHWGSVDAPTMSPFNGNPEDLFSRVIHPERIKVLAPGEVYKLNKK